MKRLTKSISRALSSVRSPCILKRSSSQGTEREQTRPSGFLRPVFAPWVKANFPNLTTTDVELLYGKDLWNLDLSRHHSLDLAEFFEMTRPKYYIVHCWLSQDIDCRTMWQLIWTFRGACLGNGGNNNCFSYYFIILNIFIEVAKNWIRQGCEKH